MRFQGRGPDARPAWSLRYARFLALLLFLLLGAQARTRAALQFDVFVGYEGVIRDAAWFPVAFEVFNDGPPFKAVIEFRSGGLGSSEQARQVRIELPTNTRKRLSIPVFSTGGGRFSQWEARLFDDSGKQRAERLSLQTKQLGWDSTMLGAIPKSFGGLPTFPESKLSREELRPQVARLSTEQFPDSVISLEGLDALYLNSEKALSLKIEQITALLGWVRGGGHLIVAVEQVADINSTPWLQQFLPMELKDASNRQIDEAVLSWIRSDTGSVDITETFKGPSPKRNNVDFANPYTTLPNDPAFIAANMSVATGTVKEGGVPVLSAQGVPLAVQANRGRGKVTLLAFSPEREPFRAWKHKGYFFAKLAQIPPAILAAKDINIWGGWGIDGVFGALIDSRQIKKLPVEWLLLLLVVYLVVIGPFDQWWLKKINRQMLTWITFPAYVVLFSLLIYFIGYKLRAGDTEWNEIHIVDVLPRGNKVDLRGRSYASIYSSSNARYQLASEPGYATLRGELLDMYNGGGGKDTSRARLEQENNGFRAEIFVPVWTSMLYVNDWFKSAETPFTASISFQDGAYRVALESFLDRPLTGLRLVVNNYVFELERLEPGEKKEITLPETKGVALNAFVQQHGGGFSNAVEGRRQSLGDASRGHLDDAPMAASALSFVGKLNENPNDHRKFITPAGLDLTPLVRRGDAVFLAWDAGHSYVRPINQFTPPRLKRDSFLRLAVPVKKVSPLQ